MRTAPAVHAAAGQRTAPHHLQDRQAQLRQAQDRQAQDRRAHRQSGRPPRARTRPEPLLRYVPALDGFRACAVLAVMLYHAGVSWLPGGSFGVDAFFVLSGLLITSLLLAEHHRTGRIDLRRFWAGRARRLLPALVLLLLAIAVYAATLAEPAERVRLRTDGLSALVYVANWHFAFSGQGYFAAFETQSPLLHLWSLGVEEQFYLLWPLVVAALCLVARKGRRAVLLAAAVGTAGSTAALVVLNARHAEVSRLYYGTDTRAFTLLTGAALAALLASGGRTRRRPWMSGRHACRLWALTGLVAAAGMGFAFARVNGQTPALYQGGFLAFELAAAAVLASVLLAPRGPVARLLALAPLVALGRVSYGLYLWHWPLFGVLSAQRTGLHGFALLATRMAATLTAAAASYLLVETPIRHGRWKLARPRLTGKLVAVTATVATAFALILATGRPPGGEASYSDITSLAQRMQADNSRRLAALQAAHPAAATTAPATGHLASLLPPQEPERVVLMGDSLVFSLGWAMADRPTLWRMDMLNSALIGCGLVQGQPAGAGDRSPTELSYCNSWPQRYRFLVDAFRPHVAVLLTGRWESLDWVIDGQRMSLGDPRYEQLVAGALDRAIDILTSRGAHVLLLTAPCYQRPERPDGSAWPEDNVSRVQRFNDLLRQAQERHRGRAQLFDLYHWMCPHDSWQRRVDGYPVRSTDGLHFDPAGGALLADRLLPVIRKVAGLPPTPGG